MIEQRIGFIQGRLCSMVDGKIQAFPWKDWKLEFPRAIELGIHKIEWTLDQEDLYKNPFMNLEGQKEILDICKEYSFEIPSLTGDCFMQYPFFKKGYDKHPLLKDFEAVVNACFELGVNYIVFPLVDNSSVLNSEEEEVLISEMVKRENLLKEKNVKVVFESDFPPLKLKEFIAKFPRSVFGINYDSGNSAALGYNVSSEITAYGDRIYNIHIKDRLFNGTTVPLSEGDTEFDKLFNGLNKINYSGNIILQTARAPQGFDQDYLARFISFVKEGYCGA